MMILDNCDSPMLVKFCGQLYDLNIRYRYIAAKSEDYQTRDVSSEHDDILEAVIQKNGERAAEALLNHYRLTGGYLNTLLQDMETL
jgi:DNA-binding GntR family transcriptional regulator